MKVFYDINNCELPENCVVSIGFFDGVHLGHKFIIKKLKETAEKNQLKSLLISIWPHPLTVIKNKNILLLNSLEDKIKIIEQTGVDALLILNFDKNMAETNSSDFIDNILINKLKAKILIKGFNNSFGNKDSNDNNSQKIKTIYAEKFLVEGKYEVNSTIIRNYLLTGKLREASKLLGYNYQISGVVKHGYKIGRRIGFPTANIEPECKDIVIPENGVYAINTHINNVIYPAMLNIGNRPTFGEFKRTMEFHIINQKIELYDEQVQIEFIEKLRNEIKFNNVKSLIKQLKEDKEKCLALLNRK